MAARRRGPRIEGRIRPTLTLPEGLEAGLIGGFGVVVVFLLRDLSLGDHPLQTPSLLGTLLFEGAERARSAEFVPGAAAAYHVIHFTVWVAIGFLGSYLMSLAERSPGSRALLGAAVLASLATLVALDFWVAETGVARLHLWLGGLVGLSSLAAYLLWRHPEVTGRARRL